MNDVAGAIDAEELKSAMTKLMMVPGVGEIEAVIAAVDHDHDQTVDYEEFELKMMERTADVPQISTVQQPVPMPQVTGLSSDHIQCLSQRELGSSRRTVFRHVWFSVGVSRGHQKQCFHKTWWQHGCENHCV